MEILIWIEHITFLIIACVVAHHLWRRSREKKYQRIYEQLLKFRDMHPRITPLIDEVIRLEDLSKIDLMTKNDVVHFIRDKALSIQRRQNEGVRNGLLAIADIIEEKL